MTDVSAGPCSSLTDPVAFPLSSSEVSAESEAEPLADPWVFWSPFLGFFHKP